MSPDNRFGLSKRILLTGGSSFTGFWFARRLVESGFSVCCPLPNDKRSYEGIKKRRLDTLAETVDLFYNIPFGSVEFINLLDGHFENLCLHGAFVKGYQNNDFGFGKAVGQNLNEIDRVFEKAKQNGCLGIIWTSSIFEDAVNTDEEFSKGSALPWFKYALSKKISYLSAREIALNSGLSFLRYIIPNPFGPYEDKKLTFHIIKSLHLGNDVSLKTPYYIRDMIHVEHLASDYVRCIQSLDGLCESSTNRPSEYPLSIMEFATILCEEYNKRYGSNHKVIKSEQENHKEPAKMFNNQKGRLSLPDYDDAKSWDHIFQYYSDHNSLCD